MGPTCSIIFENEPMEENTMQNKPRPLATSFFNWNELTTSIIQGLVITLGSLASYQYAVYNGLGEEATRTMVFIVLIAANILLTLVNRSFYYSIFKTMRYKNNLVPLIIGITVVITASLLFVPQINTFFGFDILTTSQLLVAVAIGSVSVIWYEIVKFYKRTKKVI